MALEEEERKGGDHSVEPRVATQPLICYPRLPAERQSRDSPFCQAISDGEVDNHYHHGGENHMVLMRLDRRQRLSVRSVTAGDMYLEDNFVQPDGAWTSKLRRSVMHCIWDLSCDQRS